MIIAVFGATGRVARPILDEALDRGHEVTAVTREPAHVSLRSHGNLRVEQGDILAGVKDAVTGHDAVISAIGPPRGTDGRLVVEAAHSLVRGLMEASVPRLLVVGSAGTLEVTPGTRYLDTVEFPDTARQAASAHLAALTVYSESQLDWTVLSPAEEFNPGERTKRYRTVAGTLIRDDYAKSWISFEDYAIALIDEAENPNFLRRHMSVGY